MRRNKFLILAITVIALMMVSAVQADPITKVTVTGGVQPLLPGPLAVGTKMYTDRTVTVVQVPDFLLGADYVQTAMGDKYSTNYTLSLDLAVAADVYLLIDGRVGDPANVWDDSPTLTDKMKWVTEMGYEKVAGATAKHSGDGTIFAVYKKLFAAGTAVLVGKEQNDGGTRGMYAVAAIASKTNNASNPRPKNLATSVSIDTVLAWDAPLNPVIDPATVKYYVFMDPNETKVRTSNANANLCSFYSGEMLATLTVDPSPAGNLPYEQKYYWKVDTKLTLPGETTPKVFDGSVWSFTTAPLNSQPVANAGDSIVTWLDKAQSGTVQLKGSVIDLENDSIESWTAYRLAFPTNVPATEVTFADASSLTTTVTISATGEYTLKLTANDGVNPPTSSAMKITVYADACAAAKNNPTVVYTKNPYDFNDDCQVDVHDLMSIAGKWLNSTAATDDARFAATVGDPRYALFSEYWLTIPGGSDPNLLLNDPRYPDSPTGREFITSTFKFPGRNLDHYGQRIRGYIVAPATGDYTFYISSDDNSRLFLSTDTNPANAVMIAYSGYTALDNWTANASQASAPKSLTADKYYYVEAILKENDGTDYLSVGWKKPGDTAIEVVPGSALRWYLLP